MPPRKTGLPATPRSSRSRAAGNQVTKGPSAAKKAKVTDVEKDDSEIPSASTEVVSSKKEKPADGKDKPEEGKVVAVSSSARNRRRAASGKGKRSDEVALPELKRPKRPKTGSKQVKEDVIEDKGSPVSLPTTSNHSTRTIIIEACTQCRSFKERADKVKSGLESAIPGISVEINPQKPRRGYFEIREEKTEVFLSLPSMKRPFTAMKQLNMDEVVKDLIERCE